MLGVSKKRTADLFFSYGGTGSEILFSFFLIYILTDLGGLEVLGCWVGTKSYLTLLSKFIFLPTLDATTRFLNLQYRLEGRMMPCFYAGLTYDITSALIFVLISYLTIPYVGQIIDIKCISEYEFVLFIIYTALIQVKQTVLGYYTARENFKIVNYSRMLESALSIIFLCFLWVDLFEFNLTYIFTAFITISTINVCLLYVLYLYKINNISRRFFSKKRYIYYINLYKNFIVKIYITTSIKGLYQHLDDILISNYLGAQQLGLYSTLKKFTALINSFILPIIKISVPIFAKHIAGKAFEKIESIIKIAYQKMLISALPVFAFLLLCTVVYFGLQDLRFGLRDIGLFTLMFVTVYVTNLTWWSRAFTVATDPKLGITASLISLGILILIGIPLLIFLDLYGLVIGTLISQSSLFLYWNVKLKSVGKDFALTTNE